MSVQRDIRSQNIYTSTRRRIKKCLHQNIYTKKWLHKTSLSSSQWGEGGWGGAIYCPPTYFSLGTYPLDYLSYYGWGYNNGGHPIDPPSNLLDCLVATHRELGIYLLDCHWDLIESVIICHLLSKYLHLPRILVYRNQYTLTSYLYIVSLCLLCIPLHS